MNARIWIWRDVGTPAPRMLFVPSRTPPTHVTVPPVGAPSYEQLNRDGSVGAEVSRASKKRVPAGRKSLTVTPEIESLPRFEIVSVYVSRPLRAIGERFCDFSIVSS